MTIDISILLIIIGCALVTFIPRIVPFAVVRNLKLPSAILKWLSYIPICLLTALIAQGLLKQTESSIPSIDWHNLIILIPTLLTAIKTKSLLATVLAGIVSAALVRWVL